MKYLLFILSILIFSCSSDDDIKPEPVNIRIEVESTNYTAIEYYFEEDGERLSERSLDGRDKESVSSPYILERNGFDGKEFTVSINKTVDGKVLKAKLFVNGVLTDEDINDMVVNPNTVATYIYIYLFYKRE